MGFFLEPDLVEVNCDKILKELGIDYLDLFLIHWPNNKKPLSDIVSRMLKMKEKGKVLNVGVSHFTIHHIQDLLDDGLNIAVNQVEFHPYLHQKELLEFCTKNKIVLTAYSPLAHGEILKDAVLIQMAKDYDKTSGQISLKWLLQKGLVIIPKGSSEGHLKENLDLFDFTLSDEDRKKIDALHTNKRIIYPDLHEFDY